MPGQRNSVSLSRKQQSGSQSDTRSKTPSAHQPALASQSEVQRAVKNPSTKTLTPHVIQTLQRQHGNRYVQRLIQKTHRPSPKTRSIQRTGRFRRGLEVGESVVDEPVTDTTIDTIGTLGDYLGADPTKGLQIGGETSGTGNAWTGAGQSGAGAGMSIGTGGVTVIMGGIQGGRNIYEWHKAGKELETVEPAFKGGDKALYATVELLNRKKAAAQKGTAEAAGGILGGISGLINGIAGLGTSAAAAITAGVAFSVGAGLNAIIGTIQAIRAFVSAGKRAKSQESMANVISAYVSVAGNIEQSISAKQGEVVTLTQQKGTATTRIAETENEARKLRNDLNAKKISRDDATARAKALQTERTTLRQQIVDADTRLPILATEIQQAEQKFDEVDRMRVSLAMSKRKMGFKGKLTAGGLNLGAALGGALLFAATLGAATGPAGWVISGIALIGTLAFAIGMKVKQSIRASNVDRMRAELELVNEYINSGKISGVDVPGAATTPDDRKQDDWSRDMFTGKTTGSGTTVAKKGWFNRLISKKKSGTMNMEQRQKELMDYLAKYDKSEAGDTIFEGFRKALAPGVDGDELVDNPKYDQNKPAAQQTGIPPKIALRSTIEDLLKHFFGPGADNMKESMLSPDQAKSDKAKALLRQKMKLS